MCSACLCIEHSRDSVKYYSHLRFFVCIYIYIYIYIYICMSTFSSIFFCLIFSLVHMSSDINFQEGWDPGHTWDSCQGSSQ